MLESEWGRELNSAITVCDMDGTIVYMNDKSISQFASDGGALLIGKNLFDCHPAAARAKIEELLKNRTANTYTIEKNGMKKIIRQEPWYINGEIAGLVEFSFVLPEVIPHFVRE